MVLKTLGFFSDFSTGPFFDFFFSVERESQGESNQKLGFWGKLKTHYILRFEFLLSSGFTD